MEANAALDAEVDVVVVGAGIVGVSAALRAARAGARVLVVDAGHAGKASAAGAGIVSPVGLGGNEARADWSRLVASAISHYNGILAHLDAAGVSETGFRQVGELVVATRDDDRTRLDELLLRLRTFAREGIPVGTVEPVDGRRLTGFWPELRGDLDGLYIENVARMDGRRMCDVLAALARAQGARFIEATADLELVDGAVSASIAGTPLRARHIVLATGAWLQHLLGALHAAVGVRPVRGQIVHLALAGAATGARPVVNTFEGHYFLGFPGHRIVTGATHEPDAGFDARVTLGGVHAILSRALRIAPGLAAAEPIETRVGLRPQSRDGYPIVGRPRGASNVVVATGLGAWGLTLGPLLGEIAAEQALGLTPAFDAGFLGPDRVPIAAAASLSPPPR